MAWFVKIEKGIVPKSVFDQFVPSHKAYVQKLIEEGREAKSGYWGELGGGMLIFKADSLAEAEIIVRNDPLVQNNCVEYQLHEWRVVVS